MENVNDILNAEFKNIYALEKQTVELLPKLLERTQNKKLHHRIAKIQKKVSKQYEKVSELLKQHELNPGNVLDSVAQEMLNNLNEISNLSIENELKDIGCWTSLNRLMAYRTACYRNTEYLAKHLKMNDLATELHKIYKYNATEADKVFNVRKKLMK